MKDFFLQAELKSFFDDIGQSLASDREQRKEHEKRESPAFNSLNFFWLGENKISELLAFFLNPNETHAQGEVFLKCFLDRFELWPEVKSNQSLRQARVELEHRTDHFRRIDVTIEFEDINFWIGIENKVGTAADQPDQLSHYADYLSKKSNCYILLYLTPDGNLPSIESIGELRRKQLEESGVLRYLSYRGHIIDLIDEFEDNSESEKVKTFIRDFNQKLRQWYGGETNMGESTHIKEFIIENNKVALTLDIFEAKDEVLQSLLFSLVAELKTYLEKQGYEILELHESLKKVLYSGSGVRFLRIRKNLGNASEIGFEFEARYGGGFSYGIIEKDAQNYFNKLPSYEKYLTSSLWPIYNYFDEVFNNWGTSIVPWRLMIRPSKGEESPMMKELRERIEELEGEISASARMR